MSMSIINADADHYVDDNIADVNSTKHVGAQSLLGPAAANAQSMSYSTLGVAPAGVAQQSPVFSSPHQETLLRNG